MCELNVEHQVRSLCETSVIQGAWQRGAALSVHGLIYGIADGLLQRLGEPVTA